MDNRRLKRNLPLLIVAAGAIAFTVYVAVEIMIGATFNGSWRSGPLVSALMYFTKNVTSTISSWGYIGLFGLMILEASSLPIPSEIVLTFSGYLVSKEMLNLWFTLAVATAGALIGSLVDYYIGLKGYQAITKYRLFGRSICSESQLQTAVNWFTRYGSLIVFLARLVPVFRTIISFPAGAVKMPLAKFAALTIAGCLIWNMLLIYVGYYLGSNWADVTDISHYIAIAVLATFTAIGVYWYIRRRRRLAACNLNFIV